MLNLEPVKARLAAATPGPWETMPGITGQFVYVGTPGEDAPICKMFTARKKSDYDSHLIANARTDLAALVEEVERLRAEVATRKESLQVDDHFPPADEMVARIERLRAEVEVYKDFLEAEQDDAWRLRNALSYLLGAVTEDGSKDTIMLATAEAERALSKGCKDA